MYKIFVWLAFLTPLSLSSCKTISKPQSFVKQASADVPSGFVDSPIAHNFDSPTALVAVGSDLIFIAEQKGTIRVLKNDKVQVDSFADLDVVHVDERGLLGITADPQFKDNHYLYVYYTTRTPVLHHVIDRMTEENLRMKPGSLKRIFSFPEISVNNHWHQGGALHFGPDGKLYAALGNHEDSPAEPSKANSQNLSNPFGKIVRINSDGTIPSDNPFVNDPNAYPAIWVSGLRNPFSFGLSPRSGQLLINDVGQDKWEEINEGKPGANFGWPSAEGVSELKQFVNPVFAYGHDVGCSVMGGVFYEPAQTNFPSNFFGKYLYMDYCKGWIKTLDPQTFASEDFVGGLSYPVAIALADDGSIYHLDRNDQSKESDGNGSLGKITYSGSKNPRITLQPDSKKIYIGKPFELKAEAKDSSSIQWQRNGQDIAGAQASTYRIDAVSDGDNGAKFRAVFKNDSGVSATVEAVLTVTHNNAPIVQLSPTNKSFHYAGGQKIEITGSASDSEDGVIPASRLSWKVDFLHNTHSHPVLNDQKGEKVEFTTMNDHGDIANVWYRVYVTATDKSGDSATKYIELYPSTMVSSLTPVSATGSWGPYERDMSNGERAQGDGRPISINKTTYDKGLGVQAPSDIVYRLDGKCKGKFIADVGIDDETEGNGSVIFKVLIDGKEVFDSGLKKGLKNASPIAVSIEGAKELTLRVTDGGDNEYYDHADWGSARVTDCEWEGK